MNLEIKILRTRSFVRKIVSWKRKLWICKRKTLNWRLTWTRSLRVHFVLKQLNKSLKISLVQITRTNLMLLSNKNISPPPYPPSNPLSCLTPLSPQSSAPTSHLNLSLLYSLWQKPPASFYYTPLKSSTRVSAPSSITSSLKSAISIDISIILRNRWKRYHKRWYRPRFISSIFWKKMSVGIF